MRSLSLVVLQVLICYSINAQTSVKSVSKPPLSISDLGKWPSVSSPKLSNDGRYAMYTYKADEKESLIIKSTFSSWEKQITSASSHNAVIAENSQFVVAKSKDSLYIVNLKKDQTEGLAGVQSYKTSKEGSGEWLAYQLNDKRVVLRSLVTGKESRFPSVSEYLFNTNGTVLLLKAQTAKDSSSVQWHSLKDGKTQNIWQGQRAGNFCMDDVSGSSLAFTGDTSDNAVNSQSNALWYYRQGMDKAILLADDNTEGVEKGLNICNDMVRFNKDASKVFFYLEPPAPPNPKLGYVSVDVWSYQDANLQSQQLQEVDKPIQYLTVVNLTSTLPNQRKVIRLEHDGDEVTSDIASVKAEYVLMNHRIGNSFESNWNKSSFLSVFLVNTNDGTKKLMEDNLKLAAGHYQFSPDERFLIIYDNNHADYFSYEVNTGIKLNITKGLPVRFNIDDERLEIKALIYGIAAWINDNKAVLIYDKYDIWQIDPLGKQPPINVTNGYGRKHQFVFRLLNNGALIDNNKAVISSFSLKDKSSGFYIVQFNKKDDPKLLFVGAYKFHQILSNVKPGNSKKEKRYILGRTSSSEPLNFILTRDFTTYSSLSNVPSPNKHFNWHAAELHSWKTFDDRESQGILHKPDNFDSTKKYPVILYFYETMSQELNEFIEPNYCTGPINVSFFVTNGYLVFRPDIHYAIGKPGESAYNSVVSAAQYLSKFHWIDSTKMGIAGHSFGAFEVNYLVTRTNKFAAAVSACGVSDFISGYGDLRGNGISRQFIYEANQSRIGATLFEKPKAYITNSPVLFTNKITTPILLMTNKKDMQVSPTQSVEFFTALRRLGKKAWMLQYENGDHGVSGKSAKDYTIRMLQFFNHYLKNEPAPIWMTRGVPAKMKGVVDGFQLDHEISTPTNSLLR